MTIANDGRMNARPTSVAPATPCSKYPIAIAVCAASGPGMICARASARLYVCSVTTLRSSTRSFRM